MHQVRAPLYYVCLNVCLKECYQTKAQDENAINVVKKNLNPDILKKFKKDIKANEDIQKIPENNTEQIIDE